MERELKAALREEIKQKRRRLSPEERRRFSEEIVRRLKQLKAFDRAKVVMLYVPVGGEVDLLPLLKELIEGEKKRVALPKVTADGEMVAVEVSDLSVLREGRFKVPEPMGGRLVRPEKIDLVVVPGVAFDRRGFRLGMGKGFYDRFLPRVKGYKVGVAYEFQVVDRLPAEKHDAPVDAVITPRQTIRIREE